MFQKVEGYPDLVIDPKTGVINNTADAARQRYRQDKKRTLDLYESQREIKNLKNDVKEIKELLHQLLNK